MLPPPPAMRTAQISVEHKRTYPDGRPCPACNGYTAEWSWQTEPHSGPSFFFDHLLWGLGFTDPPPWDSAPLTLLLLFSCSLIGASFLFCRYLPYKRCCGLLFVMYFFHLILGRKRSLAPA